jgi:ABC-2 type transport system ATP-binding protein
MWNYVRDLNEKEGITIFFTTHYMEEAEKIARRVAIMDHGKIITQGTADELKKQTKTNSLEEAFLKLTGKAIREEEANSTDNLRMTRRMWRGRR